MTLLSSTVTRLIIFPFSFLFSRIDFRHFNLRMKRDTTLFAPDLKVDVSGEEIPYDTSHIYTGELYGKICFILVLFKMSFWNLKKRILLHWYLCNLDSQVRKAPWLTVQSWMVSLKVSFRATMEPTMWSQLRDTWIEKTCPSTPSSIMKMTYVSPCLIDCMCVLICVWKSATLAKPTW